MFYSHELLTDRKHGVATVWLVATLGPKFKVGMRRVTRRAIQHVDIDKACASVAEPGLGAPLALRLQSNLLYGISRVYFQQCEYVLVDAQHAHNNLRMLWKAIGTQGLDPNAGKARPETLILQDDPGFTPDDVIPDPNIDLSMFDSSVASSSQPSLLSGRSRPSSGSDPSVLGLEIPSSVSGAHDTGFPPVPTSASRDSRQEFVIDDDGFDPNVGFGFDEDGNLLDFEVVPRPATADQPRRASSAPQTSALGRQAFEDDLPLDQDGPDIEMPLPITDDYGQLLPDAEAFPATQHPAPEDPSAPPRKRPRLLRMDKTLQLRNSELVTMNENYLANMAAAKQTKAAYRAAAQGRKNAAYFVIERGLGDTGLVRDRFAGPLARFAGAALWRSLTGQDLHDQRKRSISPGPDSPVKRHRGDPEHARAHDDDNDPTLPLFDESLAIEQGRDARGLPLLEDHSSQMPWNQPSSRGTSRQGSISRLRQASAERTGARPVPPSAERRAGSRHVLSSPLRGRSRVLGQASTAPGLLEYDEEFMGVAPGYDLYGVSSDDAGDAPVASSMHYDAAAASLAGGLHDNTGPMPTQDTAFERWGPAAQLATQDADSQWLRAALERETARFLGFVVASAVPVAGLENVPVSFIAPGHEDEGTIAMPQIPGGHVPTMGEKTVAAAVTFAALLPPEQHSVLVAAQGFLHVLGLATRGLVRVRQEVGHGEIWIGVFEGGEGAGSEAGSESGAGEGDGAGPGPERRPEPRAGPEPGEEDVEVEMKEG